MLRRTSFRTRNGFTTIESLIAAVVFLVGLAGLLGALVQARSATGQARRLMQATDVANDLAEQIQLWDFKDPRLVPSSDVCANDPLDKNNVLLKPGTGESNAYKACMNNETMLTYGGARFGGLQQPSFKDEDRRNPETRFERFYIVRVQDGGNGRKLMQIWVKVLYQDAGEPRVVSTQTMRVFMGGV